MGGVSRAPVQLLSCTEGVGGYSIEKYVPEWGTHASLLHTHGAS